MDRQPELDGFEWDESGADNRAKFIGRLMEAGWKRSDAEREWAEIQVCKEGEL